MKKKIIIISIAVLLLAVILIIFLFNNILKIKEGDYIQNISFKNDIPFIDSDETAGITINDSVSNKEYMIIYGKLKKKNHPYITLIITEKNGAKSKESAYLYSWIEIKDEDDFLLTKGWNIENKKSEDEIWSTYSSISEIPVSSMSGTVTGISGDVSILKQFLEGL